MDVGMLKPTIRIYRIYFFDTNGMYQRRRTMKFTNMTKKQTSH